MKVGILHPGAMGISVAATIQNSGHEVLWLPEGRSEATRQRAARFGLLPASGLPELAERCRFLVSVCPPHGAEKVAGGVLEAGFPGVFVEANAISPERVRGIARRLEAGGVDLVDGGILGLPAWEPGQTRLYLSGPRAEETRALFAAGPLEAVCLGDGVGRASALKMCYAGHTKGTRALLWAVLAAAESLEVREALEAHWEHEAEGSSAKVHRRLQATAPKAWRWVAEMAEIAGTFGSAGMPEGFHGAAGEVYERLAPFRGREAPPSIDEVLKTLLAGTET
jgi:3-hydroxyisobutyrate dehydrogenase-like beta-hydroxyacid dehydrogenase